MGSERREKKAEPKKNIVIIRLKKSGDGGVLLLAVDEHGEKLTNGTILEITKTGRLIKWAFVDPALGFQLDAHGVIIECPPTIDH